MKKILSFVSTNEDKTKKFAEIFAREILKFKTKRAIAVGLEGELGAGKTVFAKGFARGLGLKEEMKSPTFILMRVYRSPTSQGGRTSWRIFFHIDAWRDRIDFREFLKDPRNILLVEWSDKVKKFLPRDYFLFRFRSPTSRGSRTSREITLWR